MIRGITAKKVLICSFLLLDLSDMVCASYLNPIINFVNTQLVVTFSMLGGSIAVIMFVYGAAKYVFSSDDPGA